MQKANIIQEEKGQRQSYRSRTNVNHIDTLFQYRQHLPFFYEHIDRFLYRDIDECL